MKMFPKEVYWQRRNRLRELVGDGILLFPGNSESGMNYKSNTYHYRQDSNFLYFFGINSPGFNATIDVNSNVDTIYGDNFTIDDIIWMGEQPAVEDLAEMAAVESTRGSGDLAGDIEKAVRSGKKVHILPPYRGDHYIELSRILGVSTGKIDGFISESLIRAVVELRSLKDQYEIEEIEKAVDIAYVMHTTAMKMGYPGNFEREIAGAVEGIALSHGGPVSFPVILSMDGQILHNHYHGNELVEGRMVVEDGTLLTADSTKIVNAANKSAAKVLARVD